MNAVNETMIHYGVTTFSPRFEEIYIPHPKEGHLYNIKIPPNYRLFLEGKEYFEDDIFLVIRNPIQNLYRKEMYNIHALVKTNIVFIEYTENQVSYFIEIK